MLDYFFRATADSHGLEFYGSLHIFMLIVWFSGLSIIYYNRARLKSNYWLVKKLKILFTVLLGIVVISVYLWYGFSGYMGIKDGLPLYHCRIVFIMILIYTLKPLKFMKIIIINWGLIGTVMALLFPVGDPFIFPHITFFTYFIGHIVLGWYVMLVIIGEHYKFPFEDLKLVVRVGLLFNMIQLIVNNHLDSNYGYVSKPPMFQAILGQLSSFEYTLLLFFAYILASYLAYIIGRIMVGEVILTKYKNKNEEILF